MTLHFEAQDFIELLKIRRVLLLKVIFKLILKFRACNIFIFSTDAFF